MSSLPEMYQERAKLNVAKWQANQALVILQLELTPAEGWPGKNEDARSMARDKAFAADETLRKLSAEIADLEAKLGLLEGNIQAAEAERRTDEWHIRARLCDALEARNVQRNRNGDRVEAAFDDALQHAVDVAVFDGTEIPF